MKNINDCEIELKDCLDELIEKQDYDRAKRVLKNVEGTFSLYTDYKALILEKAKQP